MKLSDALAGMGCAIVRSTKEPLTLYLRFTPRTAEHEQAWAAALTRVLTSTDEAWAVDVSRHYTHTPTDGLTYLWRLIFSGDGQAGLKTLAAPPAPLKRELDTFPLVGRLDYDALQAQGRLIGAYDMFQGAKRIDAALSANHKHSGSPSVGGS